MLLRFGIFLGSLAILAIIIPGLIWAGMYATYGEYKLVVATIKDWEIIQGQPTYQGVIIICDSQERCGSLIGVKQWDFSYPELVKYLEERFPINATISCGQYQRRPEIFSLEEKPIWSMAKSFTIVDASVIGFVVIMVLLVWGAMTIRCRRGSGILMDVD